MADVRRSKSNCSLSVKILLISCCVVSIAVVLKHSVPLIMEFAVYEAPVMWKSLVSWLKPPYLYIVINFIIITIAATSRLCQKHDEQNEVHNSVVSSEFVTHEANKIENETETEIFSSFGHEMKLPPVTVAITSEYSVTEMPLAISPAFNVNQTPIQISPEYSVTETTVVNEVVTKVEDEEEFVISRSNWSPVKRMNSSEFSSENLQSSSEKPLVSSRFSHRKPVKSSPEGGKALKVTKAKRQQDTFESTWKTITDGRHMPLTRHLRKSETFENHNRQINMVSLQQDHKNVIKSETFKDRSNNQLLPPPPPMRLSPSDNQLRKEPSLSSGKLRKEASLSQDDLNRRVEAFIKKFNEDMRLQRQESLNQYNEMVNRGAY